MSSGSRLNANSLHPAIYHLEESGVLRALHGAPGRSAVLVHTQLIRTYIHTYRNIYVSLLRSSGLFLALAAAVAEPNAVIYYWANGSHKTNSYNNGRWKVFQIYDRNSGGQRPSYMAAAGRYWSLQTSYFFFLARKTLSSGHGKLKQKLAHCVKLFSNIYNKIFRLWLLFFVLSKIPARSYVQALI